MEEHDIGRWGTVGGWSGTGSDRRMDSRPNSQQKLCSTCAKLGLDATFTVDVQHSPNCMVLKESAESGCPLCLLLWSRLLRAASETDLIESYETPVDVWAVPDSRNLKGFGLETINFRPPDQGRMVWVACRRSLAGKKDRMRVLEDDCQRGTSSCGDASATKRYRGINNGDVYGNLWLFIDSDRTTEGFLPTIQTNAELTYEAQCNFGARWLDVCDRSHPHCVPVEDTLLPSRLIDVGPINGSQEPHLYIPGQDQYGRYLALSYCWGESQPLVTSTQNIDARVQKIPFSKLPKTIRDAVIITRKLNVRYLWVDALCIIQDSIEDWQHESSKMHLIYRYATITIAAGAARSSEQGIFTRRSGIEAPPFRTRLPRTFAKAPKCMTVALPRPRSEEPLASRGWALQESIISPRIFYFGTNQMHFTCPAQMAYEDGIIVKDRWKPNVTCKDWYRIVDMYTERYLSHASDKLPALSGLARVAYESESQRAAGKFNTTEYVAGFWRGHLVQTLCWARACGWLLTSPFLRRPAVYRAPSWSWAALDGSVASSHTTYDDSCPAAAFKILEVCTQLASLDPFGAVSDGWLVLHAGIRKARCSSEDLMPMRAKENTDFYSSIPSKLEPLLGIRELLFPETGPQRMGFCVFDTHVPDDQSFWCLHAYDETTFASGLLLIPLFDRGHNVFERIGIYRKSLGHYDPVPWSPEYDFGFEKKVVTII